MKYSHLSLRCEAMSGRDLRSFITNCRTEDLEKLTLRMKDGLGSSKYKPAEYEKLQAIVDAKQLQSVHIAQKVKRTLRTAKETKESSLLRQHRQVWSRENIKLANAGEKAEAELQGFLGLNGLGSIIDKEVLSELLDHEVLLESELDAFRCATVEPIWQLREDLQYRLTEVQHQWQHQPPQPSDWEKVLHQVNFVKDQQDAINGKLHTEYLAIEEDILSLGVEESSTKIADCLVPVDQVPEEVLYIDCPYPGLTASLIKEFQSLSEKYQSRLQSVQDRLQGLDRFCGWSADDHLRFQMTVSQYPPDLHNHRALYMDVLQRLFPHRSRQELTDHERSWDWQRFTQTQMRVVAQSWQRDRADLLFKALVTLEEARQAHQEELALHTDRKHQQDICSRLSDKLQKWRAHQEEVARLEAAIAGRQQEEEEDRLRREQERDSAMRSLQKEKVKQYYAEKQRRREELERRDQQRLTELRRLMAEQAKRDKERVQFREEALLQRRQEREAQALQRLKEEEERDSRLEALRNQVAVVAEPDPERMMGDTEAWRGRLMQQSGEEEFRLHRPLYHLNTYTDSQIVSDPRVRIEQALRAAGLHSTLYAKEVLSVVQPPRPPRRDTDSTGFKSSTKSV
ncbi:coiled-coil domain-containing protein 148 isoform X3 [Salmo trutta]|uniref:coiled-coil domain-containing protein 148 isoform X3 n=1 Tax=Salmo trutta TaxID=8032 RepID=UPI001132547C|nr:coiled-coil domain-containing protein 148 isoform X3 [Salmo trutta]